MEEKENGLTDKLFNFRPVFFTALALCFGIVYSYFRLRYGISTWWLLLLLPIVGTPFLFCLCKRDFIKRGIAMSVLLLSFGLGAVSFSTQTRDFADCTLLEGEYYVTATVTGKVDYGYNTRLTLKDVYADGSCLKSTLNAYLPNSFYDKVRLGDEVLLFGKVQTDVNFFNDYGFRANDIGDKARYTMSADTLAVTGRTTDWFLLVRSRIQRVVCAGMGQTPAAVTMAVLTGDTSAIDADLLENVRYGGIAHIFAVSGLHVGALYAFCLLLIKKTPLQKIPKLAQFVLLAALLLFYAGICGFSASVTRAVVLCLVAYAAKLIGSSIDFLEIIGFAAIIILLLCPTSLFEVGFQLSFAACLGIAFLSKRIGQVCDECGKGLRKIFPRRLTEDQKKMLEDGDTLPRSVEGRIARWIASVFSVSLSAQIATTPILLGAFGYISGWSLLLNILFVPLISAVFGVLLLFVAIACVLPIACSTFVLYLPNLLWSAALLVFEIADFSTFLLTAEKVPMAAFIAYFGGCIFLSDKWNISKKWRKVYAWACFMVFAIVLMLANL